MSVCVHECICRRKQLTAIASVCKHEHTDTHTHALEAMLSCDSMKIDGSPEACSAPTPTPPPLRQTADQINGRAQGMRNKQKKRRGERRRAIERKRMPKLRDVKKEV